MKKIIIVINNFEIGGVQKSLVNLLKEIHNKYEITVLTFFGNEEFEKNIPDDVKIIKPKSGICQLGMSARHLKGKPFLYIERMVCVALTKLFGRSFVIKLMCFGRKKYKDYDVAISYIHEGPQKNLYGGCNEFVLKMIEAKKKFGWLHCDFNLSGANNNQSKRIYADFDGIIACSEGCRKAFVKCIPQFDNKTVSVQNCNDYRQIRMLAGNGIKYDKEYFNIVTVARLSEEKGIERALEAVHKCVEKGYKIKYHIVGSGDREAFLQNKVVELKIDDNVIFHGNQLNPYPYIKNADLFLLTSYHEAAPIVFDEASCLGVPILATETTSTDEMIKDGRRGFVCENKQSDINAKLLELVSGIGKINDIKTHLETITFNNLETIEKFNKIMR